jgi:hypothetical protein
MRNERSLSGVRVRPPDHRTTCQHWIWRGFAISVRPQAGQSAPARVAGNSSATQPVKAFGEHNNYPRIADHAYANHALALWRPPHGPLEEGASPMNERPPSHLATRPALRVAREVGRGFRPSTPSLCATRTPSDTVISTATPPAPRGVGTNSPVGVDANATSHRTLSGR